MTLDYEDDGPLIAIATEEPRSHGRRKARRASIPPSVRFRVLRRDGFRCVYCGATAAEAKLQVDHIESVSEGGSDDVGNLATACHTCNIGKGDRSIVLYDPITRAILEMDEDDIETYP